MKQVAIIFLILLAASVHGAEPRKDIIAPQEFGEGVYFFEGTDIRPFGTSLAAFLKKNKCERKFAIAPFVAVRGLDQVPRTVGIYVVCQ